MLLIFLVKYVILSFKINKYESTFSIFIFSTILLFLGQIIMCLNKQMSVPGWFLETALHNTLCIAFLKDLKIVVKNLKIVVKNLKIVSKDLKCEFAGIYFCGSG